MATKQPRYIVTGETLKQKAGMEILTCGECYEQFKELKEIREYKLRDTRYVCKKCLENLMVNGRIIGEVTTMKRPQKKRPQPRKKDRVKITITENSVDEQVKKLLEEKRKAFKEFREELLKFRGFCDDCMNEFVNLSKYEIDGKNLDLCENCAQTRIVKIDKGTRRAAKVDLELEKLIEDKKQCDGCRKSKVSGTLYPCSYDGMAFNLCISCRQGIGKAITEFMIGERTKFHKTKILGGERAENLPDDISKWVCGRCGKKAPAFTQTKYEGKIQPLCDNCLEELKEVEQFSTCLNCGHLKCKHEDEGCMIEGCICGMPEPKEKSEKKEKIKIPYIDEIIAVGQMDRTLSEFKIIIDNPDLYDMATFQTLKHHIEDIELFCQYAKIRLIKIKGLPPVVAQKNRGY